MRSDHTPRLSSAVHALVRTINRYARCRGNPPQKISWRDAIAKPIPISPPANRQLLAKLLGEEHCSGMSQKDQDYLAIPGLCLCSGLYLCRLIKLTGTCAMVCTFEDGIYTEMELRIEQDLELGPKQNILGLKQFTIANTYGGLLADPFSDELRHLLLLSRPLRHLANRLLSVSRLARNHSGIDSFLIAFDRLLASRLCDRVSLRGRVPAKPLRLSERGRWATWTMTFAAVPVELLRELREAAELFDPPGPQNGPYAFGCFRWKTFAAEGIPAVQWTLLKQFFDGEKARTDVVTIDELIDAIYGKDADGKEGALNSLRRRLNDTLDRQGIPAEIKRPRGSGGFRFFISQRR